MKILAATFALVLISLTGNANHNKPVICLSVENQLDARACEGALVLTRIQDKWVLGTVKKIKPSGEIKVLIQNTLFSPDAVTPKWSNLLSERDVLTKSISEVFPEISCNGEVCRNHYVSFRTNDGRDRNGSVHGLFSNGLTIVSIDGVAGSPSLLLNFSEIREFKAAQ